MHPQTLGVTTYGNTQVVFVQGPQGFVVSAWAKAGETPVACFFRSVQADYAMALQVFHAFGPKPRRTSYTNTAPFFRAFGAF